MPTVVLPDGTRINNVPDGITRQQLVERLRSSGEFDEEFLSGLSIGKTPRPGGLQVGALETGMQLATGAVGEVVGGLAGLLSLPTSADSADVVRNVSDAITYDPRTDSGKRISETVAVPFQAIESGVDWLATHGGLGSPALQTTIKTTLLGLPSIIGARGTIRRGREIQADIDAIETKARDLGIDFDSRELRRQVADAAEAETSVALGDAMPAVQDRLRQLRDEAKAETDRLYDDARASNAEIDSANLRQLNTRLGFALSDFDIDTMPIVQRRIAEIDTLSSADRAVMLNEIEKLRQRLNRNRPASTDRAQQAALNSMKSQLDQFMDDMINRDLIRGDEGALEAWRGAREAYRSYRQRFSDDKVIRQLVEEDATPETMRAWVFGATKSGLRREAAQVVNQLGDLLGRNSPEFKALRAESVYHVIEPLIGDSPNFNAFNARYDSFIRGNPAAARALDLSDTNLDYIRRVTEAAEKTGAAPNFDFDMYQAMSQVVVGHDIARRGLMVRTATNVLRRLAGTGASERQAILGEMLGYDPTKPVIPRGGIVYASLLIEEMSRENE